ncbi:hypothetical protein GCM10010389_53010 [Streptomyces echinoruber]|uniref:Uncharacterized protein n=1 Tax=Streptomyces echinoruber TaxID=68898 RepID=A0A918RQ05_9ACTN|nr:hypothetical protein GCM10010389_53010 [Streptomyces echinoruber]
MGRCTEVRWCATKLVWTNHGVKTRRRNWSRPEGNVRGAEGSWGPGCRSHRSFRRHRGYQCPGDHAWGTASPGIVAPRGVTPA